ncbi:MAG: hypothetical protein HQL47_06120 [Gammaproteobacteria bacterium]|nr:hypothetical protein [Gammaproteobacteria bacterium]
MATIDASANGSATLGNPRVLTQVFDASENNLAQTETAGVLNIPAKCRVLYVFWEVLTVEGAARNFSIGDGTDPDGWLTTTTGNTLANGVANGAYAVLTGASTGGKYYAAADQIDVIADTAGGLTGLKLKVSALIVDF